MACQRALTRSSARGGAAGAASRGAPRRRAAARGAYGGGGGAGNGGGRADFGGRGPSFGSGGEQTTPGGIILPGAGGQERGGGGSSGSDRDVMEAKAAQTAARFRPPPSFVEAPDDDGCADDNERLKRLEMRMGSWAQLAALLPSLRKSGVDAKTIEMTTGISCGEQNDMENALVVRTSLKTAGADEGVLMRFESEAGMALLSGMVRIPIELRLSSAEWLLGNGGSPDQVKELVAAITNFNRYKGADQGFQELPGDAMAFNLWRTIDTLVVKESEGRETLERAAALSQSEEAVATIRATLSAYGGAGGGAGGGDGQSGDADKDAEAQARLPTSRMREDECKGVLVAVVGSIADADVAAKLRAAPPIARATLPFGVLEAPGGPSIFLPSAWSINRGLERAVALVVPDRSKLGGGQSNPIPEPAMLVVEAADTSGQPGAYFAVAGADGTVSLVAGGTATLSASGVLGRCVMLLLPPAKGSNSEFDAVAEGGDDDPLSRALGGGF